MGRKLAQKTMEYGVVVQYRCGMDEGRYQKRRGETSAPHLYLYRGIERFWTTPVPTWLYQRAFISPATILTVLLGSDLSR